MGSLNRTLPPLNSSFSGRGLMSNGLGNNSFKKTPLPVVKIEDGTFYIHMLCNVLDKFPEWLLQIYVIGS